MYNQYDLYEWPGPDDSPPFGVLIQYLLSGWTESFRTFSVGIGRTAAAQAALNEQLKLQGSRMTTHQLDEIVRVFKPLMDLDTSPDAIKTLSKPKPSVGPRRGSAYDHRGRRRW